MFKSFDDVLINAGAYLVASLLIGLLYLKAKASIQSHEHFVKIILKWIVGLPIFIIFIGVLIQSVNEFATNSPYIQRRLLFLSIIFIVPVICGLIDGYGSRKKAEKV